jgi:hypothetical protein
MNQANEVHSLDNHFRGVRSSSSITYDDQTSLEQGDFWSETEWNEGTDANDSVADVRTQKTFAHLRPSKTIMKKPKPQRQMMCKFKRGAPHRFQSDAGSDHEEEVSE